MVSWKRLKRKIKYFGFSRYCPVCNSFTKRFNHYGIKQRPDAMCPVCLTLERHRAIYLFLRRKTDLFSRQPLKLMHVAPEPEFSKIFKSISGMDYLSVDLYNPAAMQKVDITEIPYEQDTFDIIYCCHVLEHVPDDIKAMSEFFRILKPGRWALISVPINGDSKTTEDPSITDPKERDRLFGQHDHVRRYGMDITDRLKSVGFSVDAFTPDMYMSQAEIKKFHLGEVAEEPFFLCRKK